MMTFRILREREHRATAIVFEDGGAILHWLGWQYPNVASTSVYSGLGDLLRIHVENPSSGPTDLQLVRELSHKEALRGWDEAHQDSCEGIPAFAVVSGLVTRGDGLEPWLTAPSYVQEWEAVKRFVVGYSAFCKVTWGHDWNSRAMHERRTVPTPSGRERTT